MNFTMYVNKKLKMLTKGLIPVLTTGEEATSFMLDNLYRTETDLSFSLQDPPPVNFSQTTLDMVCEKAAALVRSSSPCKKVLDFCQAKDIGVFLVGGPVRDLLLGKIPRDIDLMITGNALSALKDLTDSDPELSVRYNPDFYTIKLTDHGNEVDVASSRTEQYKYSGALPEVKICSDILTDLKRRDFSINAIAIDLGHDLVQLKDPFGGIADLKKRTVSILHPKSFQDDPTRIIRALKFQLRLKFKLSNQTILAIKLAMESGALRNISGFRMLREIEFLIAENDSLLDPLIILQNHKIFESWTGIPVSNYHTKMEKIFNCEKIDALSTKDFFKSVLVFYYLDHIGSGFIRSQFEKFGFRQKKLKRLNQQMSFHEISEVLR